jgi:hypothetical protein
MNRMAKPVAGWIIKTVSKDNIYQYQCYDIATGELIFKNTLKNCSVNACDFLGVVHAILVRDRLKKDFCIYVDSMVTVIWVYGAYCNTMLPVDDSTKKIHESISKAVLWLKNNRKEYQVRKWREAWGTYRTK